MSAQEKAIVQRWFDEVWNKRSDATIDELLAVDAHIHGLVEPEPGMATREMFRKFHRSFCGTFPELKIRIAQIVSEGSDVAARLECEGRHVAAPAGAPPIKFGAMVFATVRNGVLVEGWNLVDEAAIKRGIEATAAVA